MKQFKTRSVFSNPIEARSPSDYYENLEKTLSEIAAEKGQVEKIMNGIGKFQDVVVVIYSIEE